MKAFEKPLSAKEEKEMIERFHNGDMEARNILVERNMRLVAHMVKKYLQADRDTDDLISVGTIGLIKAVNSFKPDKSIRLATYAAKCIDKEVSMYEPIGKDKEGNEISLIDIVGEEKEDVVEDCLFAQRVLCLYQNLDKVLNEREKTIIIRRYGLNGKEPMTQSELADRLGISRSYISRIEKKALLKLKKLLEDAKL